VDEFGVAVLVDCAGGRVRTLDGQQPRPRPVTAASVAWAVPRIVVKDVSTPAAPFYAQPVANA